MIAWTIWHVSWHPPSRKVAWMLTGVWAFALFLPLVSILISPDMRGLDFTIWVGWSNAICAALDLFFLYSSIHGLLWIYTEGKASPGRGSTGE